MEKVCNICHQSKPLTDYYQNPRRKVVEAACKKCQNKQAYERRKQPAYKFQRAKYNSQLYKKQKLEMVAHYTNGKNCCSHCGFSDIRALSVDHINGGGNKHRKEVGNQVYKFLRQNNYPEGYQILCMNCQFLKRHENKEWRTT